MTRPSLGRAVLWSVTGLACVFLVLPSLVVIPMSFDASPGLRFPPETISTVWYQGYFTRPEWTGATVNSFVVAASTTVLTTVLGTVTALGLVRGRVPLGGLARAVLLTPLVVPTIVTAVALYRFLAPLGLAGTLHGMVLAHTVLALPFVIINVSAVMQGVDWSIERAARSLGASPAKAFLLVTIPLIWPGIAAGALFAFICSFDEVVVALFLSGAGAVTLPVQMWSGLRFEVNPIVAAASTMLIVLSASVLGLSSWVRRRG